MKNSVYQRKNYQQGEPFEVMLRRFFRDIQQSGLLTEIKKRRFREKSISREKIRESARRKMVRKKIKRGY
ncbi:MAG: 30S ribosomal protein S21 [Patescibacteria group bacterium]